MARQEIIKQVVGIDIGKEKFFACYQIKDLNEHIVIKGTKSFRNDNGGYKEFLLWCKRREKPTVASTVYVMEATGIYYEDLAYFLYENGCKVSVHLAQKLTYFAKSNNLKTKTDKVDAKMIATFGIEKALETLGIWEPPSKEFRVIRDLAREHTSLKEDLTAAKNQLHAMEHAHQTYERVIELKEEMISFYQEQLKSIEKELKVLIKANHQLSNKIKNIETIKGVGFITIVKVLAEVNGFLLFKNIRQLVSYAGLDVVEKESGNFKGKTRISKKGNARLRSALYMPAMTAATHNSNIRTFYQRVNTDRKIKKHGIVAVMRKLLILIYTLWKKEEPYQIDYEMG